MIRRRPGRSPLVLSAMAARARWTEAERYSEALFGGNLTRVHAAWTVPMAVHPWDVDDLRAVAQERHRNG